MARLAALMLLFAACSMAAELADFQDLSPREVLEGWGEGLGEGQGNSVAVEDSLGAGFYGFGDTSSSFTCAPTGMEEERLQTQKEQLGEALLVAKGSARALASRMENGASELDRKAEGLRNKAEALRSLAIKKLRLGEGVASEKKDKKAEKKQEKKDKKAADKKERDEKKEAAKKKREADKKEREEKRQEQRTKRQEPKIKKAARTQAQKSSMINKARIVFGKLLSRVKPTCPVAYELIEMPIEDDDSAGSSSRRLLSEAKSSTKETVVYQPVGYSKKRVAYHDCWSGFEDAITNGSEEPPRANQTRKYTPGNATLLKPVRGCMEFPNGTATTGAEQQRCASALQCTLELGAADATQEKQWPKGTECAFQYSWPCWRSNSTLNTTLTTNTTEYFNVRPIFRKGCKCTAHKRAKCTFKYVNPLTQESVPMNCKAQTTMSVTPMPNWLSHNQTKVGEYIEKWCGEGKDGLM